MCSTSSGDEKMPSVTLSSEENRGESADRHGDFVVKGSGFPVECFISA